MRRQVLPTLALLALLGAALAPATGEAALPAAVDDRPLPSLAPMLQQATPAVVNIATLSRVQVQENPLLQDPFFRRFFDLPARPRERQTTSAGSGVIVDADKGYVLTNQHVVGEADEITVTLRDGRTLSAKLVGSDPEADVAVIQIPAENLTALPLADSDRLQVGDFVVAVGNPFGLGQTVTSGIVSALGRSGLGIEGYEDFIQTDASINPGNSGGALLNLRGELVGINTAIIGPSGGNVGIGFAIPSNMAREIMRQLVEHGEVQRGLLGVGVQDLTPELARAFELKGHRGGAVVANVVPGLPADQAGLKVGDVIIAVNDRPVKNGADLRNNVGLLRVGDKVELTILRDGKRRSIKARVAPPELAQLNGEKVHPRLGGAVLAESSEDKDQGVLIQEVAGGSPAYVAGLRRGDLIVMLNRKRVRNLKELSAAADPSAALLMNLQRGNSGFFVLLQ